MKIEIQRKDIETIVDRVALETFSIISDVLAEREDEALIAQVRASGATNKDKVVNYLEQTKLNVGRVGDRTAVQISHADLTRATELSTYKMRDVIGELSREGRMRESRIKNILTLTYVRRQQEPAKANT